MRTFGPNDDDDVDVYSAGLRMSQLLLLLILLPLMSWTLNWAALSLFAAA